MPLSFFNINRIKYVIWALSLFIFLTVSIYIIFQWDYDVEKFKVPYNVSDIESKKLTSWYIGYRHKYRDDRLLDPNGILLTNYKGRIGIQYNPVSISQYALGVFEVFIDKNTAKEREVFLRQARWLVDNIKISQDGYGVWHYNFNPKGMSDVKAPWVSAMAQGQALSVLLRAHQITGEDIYIDTARLGLNAFNYNIRNGGVKRLDEKSVFYEEVPSEQNVHILNGFIYSMLGIYDFYRVTREKEALALFNAGIHTLINNLNRYDTGYWSKYSFYKVRDLAHMTDPLANMHYHNVHISQLKVLHAITGEDTFIDYAHRWSEYQLKFVCKLKHFVRSKILFRFQRVVFKIMMQITDTDVSTKTKQAVLLLREQQLEAAA
jgi:hypothetical protein